MRIVVFAYACEPGEGSEPGAGWALARMLARLGETWVITRANNREAIERALPDTPERDRLRFTFVDLPEHLRRWKRGQRGIHLYYLLWQFSALRRARDLHRELGFDLAWHATFANAWLGSTAALLPVPFAYGPVGGGVRVPAPLVPALGLRGILFEATRSLVRGGSRYLNPLARLAWRRADLILVQNPETRTWLPRRHRSKAHVFPNVVIEQAREGGSRTPTSPRIALFAGRLIAWKGAALAIRSLRDLPGWMLVVAGDGRDEVRVRRLAVRLGVQERVRFVGRLSRDRLLDLMRDEAEVFLYPSMREEAGWVVGEAIANGLPVVCLDRGGPPVVGGSPVRPGSVRTVSRRLAERVLELSRVVPRLDRDRFTFEVRSQALERLLNRSDLGSERSSQGGSVGLRRVPAWSDRTIVAKGSSRDDLRTNGRNAG